MKNLLIIGARGYGRHVYNLITDLPEFSKTFSVKGYLDDNEEALDEYLGYPPIIDTVENYRIQPDDVFVCALGDVNYKKHYVSIILKKGGEFVNVIHPSSHIGLNSSIGIGCIIAYNVSIDCDVKIGNFVTIQTNSVIGHDSNIGNWTMIDSFGFTGGGANIGNSVTVHTRATIVPHKIVENGAIINAGSIVIRNVKEGKTVMGNPAKEILIPKIK